MAVRGGAGARPGKEAMSGPRCQCVETEAAAGSRSGVSSGYMCNPGPRSYAQPVGKKAEGLRPPGGAVRAQRCGGAEVSDRGRKWWRRRGQCLVRRMGSVSEELSLVPLHQRPELLEACADLLGEEWGKSRASRLHTLQRSSDAFPACLLLLRSQGPSEAPTAQEGPYQLVGHVRLSRVAGRPRDLFLESVVVPRALRGQGYGRQLMEATERWARARGFVCLHLTTHDKQHFYAHLGYSLGEPVQSVAFLSPAISTEVLRLFSTPPSTAITTRRRVPTAPPPPLPLPAAPPPAPLLPPAAPPPPPPTTVVWARGVLAESSRQSLLETPYHDAKGLPIFWMKKNI